MRGKDVCYHHGGKSPVGAGSATFKHGRHSKYRAIFSGDALQHYEAARQDPRYVELREEITLLDVLILEELGRAKVGEGAALWRQLEEAWAAVERAWPAQEVNTAGRHLTRIGEIIDEGASRYAVWKEIKDLVERKRRLADSERKRLISEQRVITEAEALAFVGAVVASVDRHVPERERRAAICADLAQLVQQEVSAGGGIVSGPEPQH